MAIGDLHHPTPKKAQIIGTVGFLHDHKIPFYKADIFRHFGISSRRGWQILHDGRERRHLETETRGRKKLLTPADLLAMESIIWQYGFEARALSWQGLALEAGISGISSRTIERAMGTLNYRKCIACEKGFVSPSSAKRRVRDAQLALQYRPRPEDWHDVRWSDEVHFSICSQGKIRIIRKPGERYCPDCIHHHEETPASEIRRYHAWAAIGWDFKSELHFYEVPTNTNGKMSLQIYRDEILEKVVAVWLSRGDIFVLEEDGDSGHGGGNTRKSNIVKDWKVQHGLKHYFNTPGSPDLSPIENCWRAVKQYIRANSRLGSDLQQLAIEGWKKISRCGWCGVMESGRIVKATVSV